MWPPATAVVAAPVKAMLARAAGLVPVAVSVAASLWPATAGAYSTVTLHECPGPRPFPVQASAVFVKAPDPASAIVSPPDPEPPAFLTVNACDDVCPGATVP